MDTPPDPRHVAGALGLRALAASWVFALHAWTYSSPDGSPIPLAEPFQTIVSHGRAGTSMFFVLSGFLLYAPFARAVLDGGRPPSAGQFIKRRALRLLPAYWVVLIVVSLVLGAAIIREGNQLVLGSFIDHPDLLLINLLLLQNFTPDTFITGIGPGWFVSAVAVFYLMLPALGRLGIVLGRRSRSLWGRVLAALAPAALLVVLGVSTKALAWWVVGYVFPEWNPVLVRSFLGQADRLGYGMAACVIWLAIAHVRLPRLWWSLPLVALLAAASISFVLYQLGRIPDIVLDSAYSFALALLMMLVACVAYVPRLGRLFVRLLDAPPLAALGLISYSIYLWHEPIISWMREKGWTLSGGAGYAINLLTIGTVVVILSTITYYFFERPFTSRGHRPGQSVLSARRVAARTTSVN